MNKTDRLFLEALKVSLKDERVQWEEEISAQEWRDLFHLAELHQILPMIYEAVCFCPSFRKQDAGLLQPVKQEVIRSVILQGRKTMEVLQLLNHLQKAGVCPLVVKGLICRNLYPKPDYRFSGDEDILIPEEQYPICHAAMLSYGMSVMTPEKDIYKEYEVPYGKQGSTLYIELHKKLFSPESGAYGDWNRFFGQVFDRAVEVKIQGASVRTLSYTDHLFYLICHAFKHFLHSGFGIRQVCDIVMFANAYGEMIDWQYLLAQCREIRADQFTAALFAIGRKYLVFSEDKACLSPEWKAIQVDETALLEDLLSSGVFGKSDMGRVHSSNITLNAVADQKKGKKPSSWTMVLKTAFPSAVYMEGRYPWLNKYPFLLPAAWADRILRYGKEIRRRNGNENAADSVRIGNERVELLKKYGVLK